MHPIELANQLKKHLQGNIIQDITTDSLTYPLPSRALAPCCGRLVTGIRYLKPGNGAGPSGQIQVLLEPPTLPDEPHALTLPGSILDLRCRAYGLILRLPHCTLDFALAPITGRTPYTLTPDRLEPDQAALFRWALAHNHGRLSLANLRRRLGYSHNRAKIWYAAWRRVGWLSPTHNHYGSCLTPTAHDALALAATGDRQNVEEVQPCV